MKNKIQRDIIRLTLEQKKAASENRTSEILVISSYPPRECGIATYSQDLITALNNKFQSSFLIKVCAVETSKHKHSYPKEVAYVLESDNQKSYIDLAENINKNDTIQMVLIQHEFGLFRTNETDFITLLTIITKPIIIVFHTILPQPDELFKRSVQKLISFTKAVIVMTHSSKKILIDDYSVSPHKISIIPHGIHLVAHTDKDVLKRKYGLSGKKVLATFGLLSSGKSIETTLDALPEIIQEVPDVVFLIIGKTHPSVVKHEGEVYRAMLKEKIKKSGLQQNVKFINKYLPLDELLEYLQLTDIYLFTSKDRNQAVSGTFSYAISCGCPIISTPIPHALEVLENNTGIIIDFENPKQLAEQVIHLLNDEPLRINISLNGLHKMAPNAWENSAISHAVLMDKLIHHKLSLHYKIPDINLNHLKKLTTEIGIIQFSIINKPDKTSGYTLDDNARALIAMCQHFELTKDTADIEYLVCYFNFIKFCLQPEGNFLNYVDDNMNFTAQNKLVNLEDANGRAIWALGYLISIGDLLPERFVAEAQAIMKIALRNSIKSRSPRAIGFIIKGIYYSNSKIKSDENITNVRGLANSLVQMFETESNPEWLWFERYLTYANSVLSEALIYAWLLTEDQQYKKTAKITFDFLLSKIFKETKIKVISNNGWMHYKEGILPEEKGGEQPIDVAYTILALRLFYEVYKEKDYLNKMSIGFNWFLGKNHLHRIIYNPLTGGCYDGLEDNYVNLNQGAESTVSYLMARLAMEKYFPELAKKNITAGILLKRTRKTMPGVRSYPLRKQNVTCLKHGNYENYKNNYRSIYGYLYSVLMNQKKNL